MRKLTIFGKKPQPITESSRIITILNRGQATITLKPDGVIIVSSYTVPEGAVKRDTRYKDAVYNMSEQMIRLYDEQTLAYTQLHRRIKKTIFSKRSFENKVDKIVRETYVRRKFNLQEPTADEVIQDLRTEAEAIYHNSPNKSAEVTKYINDNLADFLKDRKAKWQEARALFNEIENAQESKTNEVYQRKYDAERNEELSFVNGDPSKVEPAIENVLSGLDNPFSFDIQYFYSQADGTIAAEVELRNGVELPLQKGEMLASGKISVKNKLMREVAQQTTDTIFSFLFYLAWQLFATSPNIDHVKIAIWEGGKMNGFVWVDFSRTEFAKRISSTMIPSTEILCFPHVYDLRSKNSATVLSPIDSYKFKQLIAQTSNGIFINDSPIGDETPESESSSSLFDALPETIKELLKQGQLLSAIKSYKEIYGGGLADAKIHIDKVRKEIADKEKAEFSLNNINSDNIEDKIRKLLVQNRKLEAIKLYKDFAGVSLKEAMDYVNSHY